MLEPSRDEAFCRMVGANDAKSAAAAYLAGTVVAPPQMLEGMTEIDFKVLQAAYEYMNPDRTITQDEAARTFANYSSESVLASILSRCYILGAI